MESRALGPRPLTLVIALQTLMARSVDQMGRPFREVRLPTMPKAPSLAFPPCTGWRNLLYGWPNAALVNLSPSARKAAMASSRVTSAWIPAGAALSLGGQYLAP